MFTQFLIEGFLQEPVYIHFLPSIISASAIFLAYYTTKQVPWPQVMQDSSGFALTDLSECLHALHSSYIKICSTESSLKAVRDKYAQDKFHRVSSITPPPLIKYV